MKVRREEPVFRRETKPVMTFNYSANYGCSAIKTL